MISRCPNRRASRENAPGPSKTIDAAMVRARISDVFESSDIDDDSGSREISVPTIPIPASMPMIEFQCIRT